MNPNLPATRADAPLVVHGEEPTTPLPRRQPLSVAYLPIALVTFLIIAFVIATWTFLAAGG
jgi:hypothetical protein